MLLCVVRFISLRFGLNLWLADWFVVGWLLLFVWFWLPFVGVCCCFAGAVVACGVCLFCCFVVTMVLWLFLLILFLMVCCAFGCAVWVALCL